MSSVVSTDVRRGLWRSRWAAVGAAVAVTFGAGGLFAVNAASPESSTVAIDPVRILDTRTDVGLAGPFVSPVSQDLKVTGSIPTATGTKIVVPAGATGVFLNLTPVSSTAAGFISVRPATATGLPTTSNVNFTVGAINPNAVLVELPIGGGDDGKIEITYDAFGTAGPTTEVLVDVVGYTTDTRLKAIETSLAGKANAADVYTKTEVDAMTGVASATRTSPLNLENSDQVVLTANITTVGGTSLLVSAAVEVLADGGDNDNMNCNIDVDGLDGVRQSVDLADAGFNNKSVLTLTQVFSVAAGVHTVNIECNEGIGSNSTVESGALSILGTK